jgi:FkbM family methyltransferase
MAPWLFRGYRLRSGSEAITVIGPRKRAIRIAQSQSAYTWELFRDFDFWHGAVEPELVDGMALTDYSSPRNHALRPSGEVYRFLALPEPYVVTSAFLKVADLNPGDLVLDIGAYCGATCVAFARAVGTSGHVVALEPDPVAAEACRENAARYAPGQVTVIESAVWTKTGSVSFVAEANVGSAVASVLPRAGRIREVPALSLKDAVTTACRMTGKPRVAVAKFNIEGAEAPVFGAGIEILREQKTTILVEPHVDDTGAFNTPYLLFALQQSGYRTQLMDQEKSAIPFIAAYID